MIGRKKILVLLEVEVDSNVPANQLRKHIRDEAHAAKGHFFPEDWQNGIIVNLKNITAFKTMIKRQTTRQHKQMSKQKRWGMG